MWNIISELLYKVTRLENENEELKEELEHLENLLSCKQKYLNEVISKIRNLAKEVS